MTEAVIVSDGTLLSLAFFSNVSYWINMQSSDEVKIELARKAGINLKPEMEEP